MPMSLSMLVHGVCKVFKKQIQQVTMTMTTLIECGSEKCQASGPVDMNDGGHDSSKKNLLAQEDLQRHRHCKSSVCRDVCVVHKL